MVIHGSALSPFTRKVVLTAMEKGIVFESRDLNPYASPEDFQSMSPLRRVPIVQDGAFQTDSSPRLCRDTAPIRDDLSPADARVNFQQASIMAKKG